MGRQQRQSYCNRCERPTLHVRETYDVPHLIHLIITIFLCGLWLPIWILHTLSNSLGSTASFLCGDCGQKTGQRTGEQKAAAWQQRGETATKVASAGVSVSAAVSTTVWATARSAATGLWGELQKLPGQTDRMLRVIAVAAP